MNPDRLLRSFLILALSATLCGCHGNEVNTPHSKSAVFFDTIISIEVYTEDENNADSVLNECMNICRKYQDMFDENIPESDIAKINMAGDGTVSVSKDTVSLISSALSYCKDTNGLFDITIDPVSDLWDFHDENAHIPVDTEIRKALLLVDHNNISVDDTQNTVTVRGGARVDVGAAAKGYIADRLTDYLKRAGITGSIVNIGGDLYLLGHKPSGSLFNIGINDPESDGITADLYLSDKAVATSGTYERCFTKNGKKYHHILDTKTGYPVDTDIESVTVICDNALDSDCLCTVCILLGSERAMDLINNRADTEAIMIKTDGSIIMSDNASSYIRQ